MESIYKSGMKKLFISVGLAAAGTAGLHAAILDPETKDWTVAATLRGFYDDNYTTSSSKRASIGFEINPSFSYNAPFQQTELGVRYTYGLYYFQDRSSRSQNPIDQTHQFDLWIDHAFNPRWDLNFAESATISQDPPLTDKASATTRRVSGDNLANNATISVHTDWTRLFSTLVSYNNSYTRYANRTPGVGPGGSVIPSLAGLLDRLDQTINLEGQWKVSPTTQAKAGYMFEAVNYLGDEVVAVNPITLAQYKSSLRDSYSHFVYAGVSHSFLENLNGMIKAGAQYITYPNDPANTTSFGPYADASLVYTYRPGGYIQAGFTQARNATDVVQLDTKGHITRDQESSVLYASISQPLTPRLVGSGVMHYQHSIYEGGGFDGQSADFYNLGLNLNYTFARHFSSDLGYNFDYYTSNADGHYTRNRIYLGFTATY